MRSFLFLLIHLLITLAKLLGPGGVKAVLAEHLLIKQQLLVINLYDSFYNRSVNQFFIRSATNCIQFSEWIYHYPDLIDRINRYIADHKIPAFFDDPGRISLWTIPLLRSNRTDQQTKGEKNTGIQVEKL